MGSVSDPEGMPDLTWFLRVASSTPPTDFCNCNSVYLDILTYLIFLSSIRKWTSISRRLTKYNCLIFTGAWGANKVSLEFAVPDDVSPPIFGFSGAAGLDIKIPWIYQ